MDTILQVAYYAKIQKDGDGYLVIFRDIENAFTYGTTYSEAILNATEVLDLMLLDLVEKQSPIPKASKKRKGEILIFASPDVAAPVLLHCLRLDSHFTLKAVAKKMGVPYQSYQRMEFGKNLTLKTIKRAAKALGATVEIRLHRLVEE